MWVWVWARKGREETSVMIWRVAEHPWEPVEVEGLEELEELEEWEPA